MTNRVVKSMKVLVKLFSKKPRKKIPPNSPTDHRSVETPDSVSPHTEQQDFGVQTDTVYESDTPITPRNDVGELSYELDDTARSPSPARSDQIPSLASPVSPDPTTPPVLPSNPPIVPFIQRRIHTYADLPRISIPSALEPTFRLKASTRPLIESPVYSPFSPPPNDIGVPLNGDPFARYDGRQMQYVPHAGASAEPVESPYVRSPASYPSAYPSSNDADDERGHPVLGRQEHEAFSTLSGLYESVPLFPSPPDGHPPNQIPQGSIGRASSGRVHRVTFTASGISRLKKVVNLTTLTPTSLEALEYELRVLYDLWKAQCAEMHNDGACRDSAGLQFLVQMPPIANILWPPMQIIGEELHLISDYYPWTLDQFCGRIPVTGEVNARGDFLVDVIIYFLTNELVQGLSYLHKRGIIHMNINPSNIFLTHDHHCIISDFGGSIVLPKENRNFGLSARYQTYSTAGFRAPEVPAYDQSFSRIGCKADIWSLGVTLYRMLVPRETDDELLLLEEYSKPEAMRAELEKQGLHTPAIDLILSMVVHNSQDRVDADAIIDKLKETGTFYESCAPSPLHYLSPQAPRALNQHEAGEGNLTSNQPYVALGLVINNLQEHMKKICGFDISVNA